MPRRLMLVVFFFLVHSVIVVDIRAVDLSQPNSYAYPTLTDQQVTEAIDSLKRHLYDIQNPDGSWDLQYPQYRGGETAIVVYALLAAGESSQHPQLEKAIEWLKNVPMDQTYCRSLRLHVWAQLPESYSKYLNDDAQWLIRASNINQQGLFSYRLQSGQNYDNSNVQYGVLGLWEAAKRDVTVPRDFWQKINRHFHQTQVDKTGGWAYRGTDSGANGSMTCAGLTALLICDQQLNRRSLRPNVQMARDIDLGFRWMDRNFDGHRNPNRGGYAYYYLYGVERVGLAGGYRYFNGQDWFDAGARYVLGKIRGMGDSEFGGTIFSDGRSDAAFALLFLARGRVPVWVGKLYDDRQQWDNRPYDMAMFTSHLSGLREGEMNWQLIDIDMSAASWLYTPLLWLSTYQPIELKDDEIDRLRSYLELGGTLFINPEKNTQQLRDSIEQLGKRLFPRYQWRTLQSDHPVYTALYQVKDEAAANPLMGMSNGVRDLILVAGDDWGKTFQALNPGQRPEQWRMMTNVFAWVTNRGHMSGRMDTPYEFPVERMMKGQMTVGRLDCGGIWNPEPAMWIPVATRMLARTGVQVKLARVDIDKLADCQYKLVHMAGIDPVQLSDQQLQAIKKYAEGGGTVLIETIGGRGGFSHAAAGELSRVFGWAPTRLGNDWPVYTGNGLAGGYDCTNLQPRRTSVLDVQRSKAPSQWIAFYVDDRPAVIISHDDLGLGMLGVRQWGIRGYTRESTRRLMVNLLSWVDGM